LRPGDYDESDVKIRSGRGSRPRTKIRPEHADAESAMVVSVDRGRWGCVLDGDPDRRVTAMRARELGRTPIVVGDEVDVVGDLSGRPDTLARIVRRGERRTVLRRTADDTDPTERVVVANADQLLIVVALADPPPRTGLVERTLIAAECIGDGYWFIDRAARYAKERVVFGRPIGQNQAIQHPLAQAWMQLEAANLMVMKAATLYDSGKPCGAEANSAKYLAAEAAFQSCQTAIATLGGMGYAKEYHVERYLRESFIPRLAPVSPQMIMCFIAEKVLGLPKSY